MNRQRLSGTFFAACKVFSNHERYLKYDRVIELTQIQTGQLFDLLKAVHQRIAVYEQLARRLGHVQVVLEELLNREQRLLMSPACRCCAMATRVSASALRNCSSSGAATPAAGAALTVR